MRNITVPASVGSDGVWLQFDSPTGKHACVSAERIASVLPPLAAKAVREWAEFQQHLDRLPDNDQGD